jgi:hypothetical protein
MNHAFVHRCTVNGQEVDVLIRTSISNGSLFIDLVFDESIANLSANVLLMNITGTGNPHPTKTVVDKQALVAAGGS